MASTSLDGSFLLFDLDSYEGRLQCKLTLDSNNLDYTDAMDVDQGQPSAAAIDPYRLCFNPANSNLFATGQLSL